ncbi:MAG: polysaccharide pyruvyl transferase family protein [Oligosphaeraceae bacterium]
MPTLPPSPDQQTNSASHQRQPDKPCAPHGSIRHIGILTFHRPLNFGAVLQAYALLNTLAQLHPEADISILDLVPPFLRIPPAPWHKFRKRAQQRAFLTFLSRHLPLSAKQSDSITDLTDGLDTIVVGSDQVWNPDITQAAWKNYFLDGIPDSIRACSYAASFGEGAERAFPPDIQNAMATLLKRFDRISVREESGLDICRQLGRPDAIHVLDPVLAADPHLFEPLLAEASPIQPAITSVLLDETAAQRRLLKQLGKQAGQPARLIAIRQRRLPTPGIQRPYATAIPDYLAAIRNAPLVVTDSFHAVMFSLVFQRPFIATPSTRNKRFDRIANILALLGLQDRIADQNDLQTALRLLHTPIDYHAIQPQLQQLRQRSRDFLTSI